MAAAALGQKDLESAVARLGSARILRKPIGVSLLRGAIREMLAAWETRRPQRHLRQVGKDVGPA